MKFLCLYGHGNKSKKSSKWLPFKNYKVRITKYLMCIYGGHIYICIPNMKFLCLTLCQGEVCTDHANDDNANANVDRQSMIVQGSLVDKPNEPRTICQNHYLHIWRDICAYVNIKFLCLNLWWGGGGVCTDDDADVNDTDANDDRQSMIVYGSLVD